MSDVTVPQNERTIADTPNPKDKVDTIKLLRGNVFSSDDDPFTKDTFDLCLIACMCTMAFVLHLLVGMIATDVLLPNESSPSSPSARSNSSFDPQDDQPLVEVREKERQASDIPSPLTTGANRLSCLFGTVASLSMASLFSQTRAVRLMSFVGGGLASVIKLNLMMVVIEVSFCLCLRLKRRFGDSTRSILKGLSPRSFSSSDSRRDLRSKLLVSQVSILTVITLLLASIVVYCASSCFLTISL